MEKPKKFEKRMKDMLSKAKPGLNIYVCKTSQWIMLANLLRGADLASGKYYEGINPKNGDCICFRKIGKIYRIITQHLFPSTKTMVEFLRKLSQIKVLPRLERMNDNRGFHGRII